MFYTSLIGWVFIMKHSPQKLSLCNEKFCFCHFMIFSDRQTETATDRWQKHEQLFSIRSQSFENFIFSFLEQINLVSSQEEFSSWKSIIMSSKQWFISELFLAFNQLDTVGYIYTISMQLSDSLIYSRKRWQTDD